MTNNNSKNKFNHLIQIVKKIHKFYNLMNNNSKIMNQTIIMKDNQMAA